MWDEGAHRVANAYEKYYDEHSIATSVASAYYKKRQEMEQKQKQKQHLIDHHGESTVTQHDDIDEKTLFYSGIASHVFATVALLSMGRFASVMAPPANVTMIRDHFIHGKGKTFARAAKSFTHTN